MATNDIEPVSSGDWKIELLRATVFFGPNAQFAGDNWWRDAVGNEPDTKIVRSKTGEATHQGLAFGGQLTLRLQPSRVDWLLNRVPSDVNDSNVPDFEIAVGNFADIYPQFSEVMTAWFRVVQPAPVRIALGAILLLPVTDRVHGYRQLRPYLPSVKIEPDSMSDFLYRVNRRRRSESGIDDLKINRLANWSVAAIELRGLRMARGNAEVINSQSLSFCRLEFDINTGADFLGSFSTDQSVAVFDELRRLGVEILERGDIP